MFKKFKYIISTIRKACVIFDCLHDKSFESNRLLGEIMRNTHSIEKGLAIENIRLGFGLAKIKEAYGFCIRYAEINNTMNVLPIIMFRDALLSYLDYHTLNHFSDGTIKVVSEIVDNLSKNISSKYPERRGGYLEVKKETYSNDERMIMSRLFIDRHSVREFSHTPVDESDLSAAIKLAMRCPSACNRQNYRLYIIDNNVFGTTKEWLSGVGGFSDDVNKFLLITGKMSDFRYSEELQYLVSPIVFASYLTLSLQIYGIGCCFIQRTIVPSRVNEDIKKRLEIPKDEQVVCVLGIGNLKDEYKVPISFRLEYDTIVRKR